MTALTCTCPTELTSIPQPAVVVLVGAAGSGKSTLAQCLGAHWDPHVVVSLDGCRADISGDPADQDATPEAVQQLHRLVNNRCLAGLTTVVDATNYVSEFRAPLVRMATASGLPAVAIVLTTPLPVCLARQQERPGPPPGRRWSRRVPDAVVATQHAGALNSIPILPAESFSAVHVINREGT